MSNNAKKPTLYFVQILRGIASLLIVIGHATILRGSGVGVELFFIVSGFIMMYITQKDIKGFITKRLIRIVPLYWITSIVFYFTLFEGNRIEHIITLLKSLFFINGVGGSPSPILAVGWTLNFEMVFYFIIYFATKINQKNRGIIAIALIFIWQCISLKFNFWTISTMPVLFIFGILAYYFYTLLPARIHNIAVKYSCCGIILICVLFVSSRLAETLYWSFANGNWSPYRPLVLGIPALLTFCSFAVICNNNVVNNWIIKAFTYLGDISYSLYLWHIFVQDGLKLLLNKFNIFATNHYYYKISTPNILFTCLTVLISLIVAHFSYRFIEVAISEKLKKHLCPAPANVKGDVPVFKSKTVPVCDSNNRDSSYC